jgi:hypothetical protein
MTIQQWMWTGAGASLVLAIIAGLAEGRRTKRRDLDDHGWMPWRGIQALCFFAVLLFAVLAFKL